MADPVNVKNVTKFDGQNFQLWKFQMRVIFIANDLPDIVNGTAVKPEVARQPTNYLVAKECQSNGNNVFCDGLFAAGILSDMQYRCRDVDEIIVDPRTDQCNEQVIAHDKVSRISYETRRLSRNTSLK